MGARPVLGIICCTRTVGIEPAQAVINRYVLGALKHADVNAVLIPALPHLIDAADIAARVDGLLLTGSPSNVEASRYGEADGDGPHDPERDEMVMRMVDAMAAKSAPIFGICRGFQELNVALGGTLRRDLGEPARNLSHHAPAGVGFADMFDHHHAAKLTPGGMLHRALGATDIRVNSVHFQGVARLAPGLDVEALAPDGVVEAFSTHLNGAAVLAVQWHPEWDADTNAHAQTYFKLLGRALRGDPLTGDHHGQPA